MSRLPVSLHASLRSLRLPAPSTSARLQRQPYSSSSDAGAQPPAPAGESSQAEGEVVDDKPSPKPFAAPFSLPHQYATVARPNIIPGKVPRQTFDKLVPREGVFTPENAHLSSRPLNVRKREAYVLDLLQPGELPPALQPRELQDWWQARADGVLPDSPVTAEEIRASQLQFQQDLLDVRRSKIHGTDADGNIVGQRIYLPNIVFKLIPNATNFIRPIAARTAHRYANQRNKPVAMEQYNPYIATFRVPPALNKIDIKGYLKAVYNLDTTFVHTSINHKTRFKAQNGAGAWQNGKSKDNFKRAVVGLTKPFYYPNDPLGMTLEERKSYEERLDADFMVKEYKVQEVIQRRRQFANVRNRPGLSERSAKIYPTKPAAALKHTKKAAAAAADAVRMEIAEAVRSQRAVARKAASEPSAASEDASPEDDWRSRS